MKTEEISREAFTAVMNEVTKEYDGNGVRLVEDARKGRRTKQVRLEPRTVSEVVALHQAGLVTKTEARKYLSLRPATVRTPRRQTAS